jgi:hypothetical protein
VTALLVIGIIVLILSCTISVLALHLGRKTSEKALDTLDSLHKRQSEQLDKTLDRLMTIRWEDLIALTELQKDDEGGFIPPSTQGEEEEEDEADTRWAHLRRLGTKEMSAEERALLNEDFPDAAEG